MPNRTTWHRAGWWPPVAFPSRRCATAPASGRPRALRNRLTGDGCGDRVDRGSDRLGVGDQGTTGTTGSPKTGARGERGDWDDRVTGGITGEHGGPTGSVGDWGASTPAGGVEEGLTPASLHRGRTPALGRVPGPSSAARSSAGRTSSDRRRRGDARPGRGRWRCPRAAVPLGVWSTAVRSLGGGG